MDLWNAYGRVYIYRMKLDDFVLSISEQNSSLEDNHHQLFANLFSYTIDET